MTVEERRIYMREYMREYRKKNGWKMNRRDTLAQYGLSYMRWLELLRDQDGLCAICGSENDGKTLAVDHDHATGKVRGLLCKRCNLMIGFASDDPNIMRQAIEYLEKSSCP